MSRATRNLAVVHTFQAIYTMTVGTKRFASNRNTEEILTPHTTAKAIWMCESLVGMLARDSVPALSVEAKVDHWSLIWKYRKFHRQGRLGEMQRN